jgi:hypothetical protein
MLLYSVVNEILIFPYEKSVVETKNITNGVIYYKNGRFDGIFSTCPSDYLYISEFKNGGNYCGIRQQK